MSHRNAERLSQQHLKQISRRVREVEAVDFFNLLTGPELLEMTDSLLPEHRERLYPPTLALSMFMGQVLDEDGSCQKAVDGWAAQRAAEGLSVRSVNTVPTARRARDCRSRWSAHSPGTRQNCCTPARIRDWAGGDGA
jgi:hypothetical protein